jgi:RNAse (barnase) inhibitor barstar
MQYQIDGARFSALEEFFDEVSRVLVPGRQWGHHLDAFNDILVGGFGTPSGGFTIDWKDHALSQERLGYDETIRQLELRAESCHPQNRDKILADLATA